MIVYDARWVPFLSDRGATKEKCYTRLRSHQQREAGEQCSTTKAWSSRSLGQQGGHKEGHYLGVSSEDFISFRDLLGIVPCDKALEGSGIQEIWLQGSGITSSWLGSDAFHWRGIWVKVTGVLHGWTRSSSTRRSTKTQTLKGSLNEGRAERSTEKLSEETLIKTGRLKSW